jgi:uncharacterized protein YuzE
MEKNLDRFGIDWNTGDNILDFDVFYDEKSDILSMQSKENRSAVSVDLSGEFWVRIDPQTGEIIGLEIEDFKNIFLKKHPEIAKSKNTYARPIADLIKLEHCMV